MNCYLRKGIKNFYSNVISTQEIVWEINTISVRIFKSLRNDFELFFEKLFVWTKYQKSWN
jgi:hypothetical protein